MPKPKPAAPVAAAPPAAPAVESEVSKDNNRGGRARGKDNARRGEKKHGKEAEAEGRNHRRVKHEKDRHSATEKEGANRPRRGGRGAYNVGSVEQEAQEAEKDPEAAVADATADATEAAAEPAAEPEAAAEVVEGVKTITLDDYLRQKDSSKVLGLSRSTLLTEEETKTAKNVKKAAVDLSFKFDSGIPAPRPREDGDRNNRRNDSRGAPRGQKGPRGGDAKKSGPAVSISASDFPALL